MFDLNSDIDDWGWGGNFWLFDIRLFDLGVWITRFFCGLGTRVMEGTWAAFVGGAVERGDMIIGNNIVEP